MTATACCLIFRRCGGIVKATTNKEKQYGNKSGMPLEDDSTVSREVSGDFNEEILQMVLYRRKIHIYRYARAYRFSRIAYVKRTVSARAGESVFFGNAAEAWSLEKVKRAKISPLHHMRNGEFSSMRLLRRKARDTIRVLP